MRVDACAAQRKDLHIVEWENRRRTEEVRKLQQVPQKPLLQRVPQVVFLHWP